MYGVFGLDVYTPTVLVFRARVRRYSVVAKVLAKVGHGIFSKIHVDHPPKLLLPPIFAPEGGRVVHLACGLPLRARFKVDLNFRCNDCEDGVASRGRLVHVGPSHHSPERGSAVGGRRSPRSPRARVVGCRAESRRGPSGIMVTSRRQRERGLSLIHI